MYKNRDGWLVGTGSAQTGGGTGATGTGQSCTGVTGTGITGAEQTSSRGIYCTLADDFASSRSDKEPDPRRKVVVQSPRTSPLKSAAQGSAYRHATIDSDQSDGATTMAPAIRGRQTSVEGKGTTQGTAAGHTSGAKSEGPSEQDVYIAGLDEMILQCPQEDLAQVEAEITFLEDEELKDTRDLTLQMEEASKRGDDERLAELADQALVNDQYYRVSLESLRRKQVRFKAAVMEAEKGAAQR